MRASPRDELDCRWTSRFPLRCQVANVSSWQIYHRKLSHLSIEDTFKNQLLREFEQGQRHKAQATVTVKSIAVTAGGEIGKMWNYFRIFDQRGWHFRHVSMVKNFVYQIADEFRKDCVIVPHPDDPCDLCAFRCDTRPRTTKADDDRCSCKAMTNTYASNATSFFLDASCFSLVRGHVYFCSCDDAC